MLLQKPSLSSHSIRAKWLKSLGHGLIMNWGLHTSTWELKWLTELRLAEQKEMMATNLELHNFLAQHITLLVRNPSYHRHMLNLSKRALWLTNYNHTCDISISGGGWQWGCAVMLYLMCWASRNMLCGWWRRDEIRGLCWVSINMWHVGGMGITSMCSRSGRTD